MHSKKNGGIKLNDLSSVGKPKKEKPPKPETGQRSLFKYFCLVFKLELVSTTRGLDQDDLSDPFQPKVLYDSVVILCFSLKVVLYKKWKID